MSNAECDHHGIVHEWGFDKDKNWTAVKFICKKCNEVRDERFPTEKVETVLEHKARCDGSCDTCVTNRHLAMSISTGAANSSGIISHNRQTEKELDAYRSARKDGIQPASTKMKDIQNAVRASEAIGVGVQV